MNFKIFSASFPLNPENILEYYINFVQLLQKANQMKMFVGDDLFEPEVKQKIDEWKVPEEFKQEEQVEQNQGKVGKWEEHDWSNDRVSEEPGVILQNPHSGWRRKCSELHVNELCPVSYSFKTGTDLVFQLGSSSSQSHNGIRLEQRDEFFRRLLPPRRQLRTRR